MAVESKSCECSKQAQHWCTTDCRYLCSICSTLTKYPLIHANSFRARKYAEMQLLFEQDAPRFEQVMVPFETALMAHWDSLGEIDRERLNLHQRYGSLALQTLDRVLKFLRRQRELYTSIINAYRALEFGKRPALPKSTARSPLEKRPRDDTQWLLHSERDQVYALSFPSQELVVTESLGLDPDARMTYYDKSFVLTGGETCGSLCLQFDTEFKLKAMLPPLPVSRHKHAAVVYRGDLYLIGGKEVTYGIDSVVALKSCGEAYRWSICSPLREPRFDCSAAVMNDRIYVVGGLMSSVIQLKQHSKQKNAINDITVQLVEVYDGTSWEDFKIKSPGFVLTALLPSATGKLLIIGGVFTNKRKGGSFYYELDVRKKALRRKATSLNTDLIFKSSSVSVEGTSYCLILKNLLICTGEEVRLHKFL